MNNQTLTIFDKDCWRDFEHPRIPSNEEMNFVGICPFWTDCISALY